MLGDDFIFARHDVGPIDFQAGNFEAKLFTIFEVVVDVSVMQKNLSRNAAYVETSATEEGIFFDDHSLEAEFAGADGRHITARTTADDCNVIFRHTKSPFAIKASRTTTMAGWLVRAPASSFRG